MKQRWSVLSPHVKLLALWLSVLLGLVCQLALGSGSHSDHPKKFVVSTKDDFLRLAETYSTSKKEIMFTTTRFWHRGQWNLDQLDYAKHLWYNLKEVGRMENTLLLSYDDATCDALLDAGIPCWVDRYSPQPSTLPGQYEHDVPHWFQKYHWTLQLLRAGYVVLFLETDTVLLKDPVPYYNAYADIEGLSDWRTAEVPGPKERYLETCNVYHQYKDDNHNQYVRFGPVTIEDDRQTRHVNPCMSTGFWYIQPTSASEEFLMDYIELIMGPRNTNIDQIVWNEAIMTYLIGHGQRRPLHLNLLDVHKFSNFEVYKWRQDQGLPVDPVMLHCGAIPGHEKQEYIQNMGMWKAELWRKEMASNFTGFLVQQFPRSLLHNQKDHSHRRHMAGKI